MKMNTLHKQVILDLADHHLDNCISIFIPTNRKGGEVNEGKDQILFKNQIQQVRTRLQETQLRSHEIDDLLRPLEELLENWAFWRYQSEGLAVFRSQEVFEYYSSPFAFEEAIQVSDRFLVRPLFRFAQTSKPYYILRLSKDNAALFKADQFSIEEVSTDGVFASGLEEVTQYYDFEEELQGRTKSSGGGPMAMHRSDDMDNKQKDHLLADYFRLVDERIKSLIGTENAPLLLASVEYYHPIYHQINTYPFLRDMGLTGHFDRTHMQELHQMANEQMSDFFVETQQKRIVQYQNNSGGDLISHDLRQILDSAVTGRIDTLFVRHDAQVWGQFDENNLTATIHDQPHDEDEPLVDKAVLLTLRYGGEAYILDDVNLLPQPDDDHAGVAALYRF